MFWFFRLINQVKELICRKYTINLKFFDISNNLTGSGFNVVWPLIVYNNWRFVLEN